MQCRRGCPKGGQYPSIVLPSPFVIIRHILKIRINMYVFICMNVFCPKHFWRTFHDKEDGSWSKSFVSCFDMELKIQKQKEFLLEPLTEPEPRSHLFCKKCKLTKSRLILVLSEWSWSTTRSRLYLFMCLVMFIYP